jgi:phospholipid N-methyltransferase
MATSYPSNSNHSAIDVSFKEFARHPSMVGSAFPASHWLVRRMLDPLDWSRIRVFVEFGPGTGRFTRKVLSRLAPDAKLVVLETGGDFVRLLESTITDNRFRVVQASADNVAEILVDQGVGKADCILSGLPFSTLDPEEARRIINASCGILNPGGQFIAYQMRSTIKALLADRFEQVDTGYEWRNIPPCHLYWAQRPASPE